MKVLVTGSRNYQNMGRISAWLEYLNPDVIVHGDYEGADTLADRWGKANGKDVRPYPADWSAHGLAAGPIRNSQMLKCEHLPNEPVDVVLAFPRGKSKGTRDMMAKADRALIRVIDGSAETVQQQSAST